MEAKLRSCWQKVRKPLEIFVIVVGCIVIITLLVVIALAYIFGVNVPGLRGKTLWDWLQLLIIPAVLAVGGYLFNLTVSRNEQKATQLRAQTEREIALDNQQEATLQEYINKMSELLLDRKLRESTEDAEVRTIARVRTLTVLRGLDAIRKASLLQFLYESGLINKDNPIIDLVGAVLNGANLIGASLHNVNLNGVELYNAHLIWARLAGTYLVRANLHVADLSRADLSGADLSEANLSGADLSGASLIDTKLTGADLSDADLSEATFVRADLSEATFVRADLRSAKLIGETSLRLANLNSANLNSANLRGADLFGTDLSAANLKNATGITNEELEKQTKSLKGATMPDGSIHP